MVLVNGKPENRVSVIDRGLQYGDGLFETIAFKNGNAEFIEQHISRLVLGCKQLKIPFQQIELLYVELNSTYQNLNNTDAVIKIIVTRGDACRGYLADPTVEPTRIISTHTYPNYPKSHNEGVCVRLCQHTLSENVVLAGIKHLNRLDNVLARNEWDDSNISEGLMFDQNGYLIEGTMSNVFLIQSGRLLTPLLDKSGVLGIMRAQIMLLAKKLNLTIEERLLTQGDLAEADEVFICNSINGIWPVKTIHNTGISYPHGSVTKQLQQALLEVER